MFRPFFPGSFRFTWLSRAHPFSPLSLARALRYLFLARPLSEILFGVCPSLLLTEIIEVFSTSRQWAFSLGTAFFARGPWIDRTFCARMGIAAFQSDAAVKLIALKHKLYISGLSRKFCRFLKNIDSSNCYIKF